MKFTHIYAFAVFIVFVFSYSVNAQQEDKGKDEDQNGDVTVLEELVVTAQRREELAQEVPVAITVFDDSSRDEIGIKTIQDFTNFAPGVSYDTEQDRMSIRGVGRLTNTIGSDPGVATYNDGLYTSSNVESSKSTMFVRRVEMLRGPQGTLYGRNSIGGSVNVISHRPANQFGGEVRYSYDQYYLGEIFEGNVSIPFSDKFKMRLSGQYGPKKTKGMFENIVDGRQEGFRSRDLLELQLQYDFSDETQFWLKYSKANWDDSRRTANLLTPYVTSDVVQQGALVPNAAFGSNVKNPGVTDPRLINVNTRDSQTLSDNNNYVLHFTTQFNNTKLKYVGGYSEYVYTDYSDIDRTSVDRVSTTAGTFLGPYSYNPTYVQEYIEDKNYYSNEVTFSNVDFDKLKWIAGLYQYSEEYFQPVTWFIDGDANNNMSQAMVTPINPFTGGLAAANPRRAFYAGNGRLETESKAVFGQLDYLFTEKLTGTLGLRYSKDQKSGVESYRLVQWNPVSPVAACFGGCGPLTPAVDLTSIVTGEGNGSGAVSRAFDDEWSGASFRLGFDYKASEETMYYGSYSQGFKAGGFTLGTWAQNPVVNEESVSALELGFKTQLSNKAQLNLSAFMYDYKDAQTPIDVQRSPSSPVRAEFFNIPEARSIGVEVESKFVPSSWFELFVNYSYLDTEVKDMGGLLIQDASIPGTPFINPVGNTLPQASKNKVAISGLVDIPINSGDLVFAANYVYRSSAYYTLLNSPNSLAPSWDQVDFRLSYVPASEKYTIITYVRNAFDDFGYDGAQAETGDNAYGFGRVLSLTPPRSYGVELQYRF